MKPTISIIPFTLLFVFLLTETAISRNFPGKEKKNENSSQELFYENEPAFSEILSTKNYVYEADPVKREEIMTIIIGEKAKATIFSDENGALHQNMEYFDSSSKPECSDKKVNDKKSLIEKFRENISDFFVTGYNEIVKDDSNNNISWDHHGGERKYFKSDYDEIN
jgi:hypothetical protein